MEKYIFYDLIDNEAVMWSCRGRQNESQYKNFLVSFVAFGPRLYMTITFLIFAFIAFSLYFGAKVWGTLLLFAVASFIFSNKVLKYNVKKSDLFFYLTDRRIIILRKNDKRQLIRSQYVADIDSIDVQKEGHNSFNLFFSPARNIDIYESDLSKGYKKRMISAKAPMTFLSAQNIEELFTVIKQQKNIDIYYKTE